MPTLHEWIDCVGLPVAKCNGYRRIKGLPPLDNATSPVADQQERKVVKSNPRKCSTSGPGTAMFGLLRELGIKAPKTCDCRKIEERMNNLGVDGCRANIDELAKAMDENQSKWEWSRRYFAWAMGGWSYATHPELWGVVNPKNPFPGLIELACRRCEKCQ